MLPPVGLYFGQDGNLDLEWVVSCSAAHFSLSFRRKTDIIYNMKAINKYYAEVMALLSLSWLLTNFVFRVGSGLDVTFFVFLLLLSFYRTSGTAGFFRIFEQTGLRLPDRRTLALTALLAGMILAADRLLAMTLKVDMADLVSRQKSVGQIGYLVAKTYAAPAASAILVILTFWSTFFEELFFRGILLRVITPYHRLTAQLLQAILFGFLHVAGSLSVGLPGNALWFLFLYPTLSGLLLGHFYLREGHSLTLVWSAHCLVNIITWLLYVNMGEII